MLASNPLLCTNEKHIFQHNKKLIQFYLMTNQFQARQQLWLFSSSNSALTAASIDDCAIFGRTKPKMAATAIAGSTWISFLLLHQQNTPLIYFLLRENPTVIVNAASVANAVAAANAAADRLAYAKLRSSVAGRRRRASHLSGKCRPNEGKGGEPIWESYF